MSKHTGLPRIDIVDVPGKGKGVIALEHIPRGTLIISEKPRISLPAVLPTAMRSNWVAASLSPDDREFLLSFPCGPDEDAILGRMKHFTPCLGDGTVGLCATICRANHVCYSPNSSPNAAYFWNVRTKREDLHAIKDIREGQEIEVSYMENVENYRNPRAHLRERFGFECSCCGCTRPDAERKASEKRIYAYNDFVNRLPGRFGKENPLLLLKDIEEQILVICEEGYTGEIQARAHDAFQLCAYYGDADSARQWEAICRDRHASYQGVNTEPYENAKKLAAKPQDFRAWGGLGRRKLRGPSERVLEYCYPNEQPAASNTASTSTAIPSARHRRRKMTLR